MGTSAVAEMGTAMDIAEANTSRPETGGLKGVRAGRERVEGGDERCWNKWMCCAP